MEYAIILTVSVVVSIYIGLVQEKSIGDMLTVVRDRFMMILRRVR
jgi:hypothetical protein